MKHYELNNNYKKVHDMYQEKVQYIDDEGDKPFVKETLLLKLRMRSL